MLIGGHKGRPAPSVHSILGQKLPPVVPQVGRQPLELARRCMQQLLLLGSQLCRHMPPLLSRAKQPVIYKWARNIFFDL